ncbi:MAG: hypothetical protein BGO31_02175 [Bacteroidetes bacterium 43-16]|nr:MAG: hypothetical protein BGO31_02175 [Bacteroidetes bacterium 43-16]
MFLIVNPIIELLALIASIIFLSKDRTWWRYFIYYLAVVVLTEGSATYLIIVEGVKTNNWIFNLYLPLQYIFYFYLFKNLLGFKRSIAKRVIIAGICLIFLVYALEIYSDGFSQLAYRSIAWSNIWFFILCCLYFFLLLKREDYFSLGTYPPFWILSGILFHALGSTMTLIFYQSLIEIYYTYKLPLKQVIYIFLNFIMYSFWIYAFLCRYQSRISSSS